MAWKRRPSTGRSQLKQKPWNKIRRDEKFWALARRGMYASSNIPLQVQSTIPTVVSILRGEDLSSDPVNAGNLGGAASHCKVHRFQGAIWAWLNNSSPGGPTSKLFSMNTAAGATDGGHAPPNIQMLTYVWLKLKDVANAMHFNAAAGSIPSDYSPHPLGDLPNLLVRDDIIKWGTIPVFGIIPRYVQQVLEDTLNEAIRYSDTALTGMYLQNHVARIPYPRVPKGGFTLKKGEGLLCMAARWDGPGAAVGTEINDEYPVDGSRFVTVYEQTRVLCSN